MTIHALPIKPSDLTDVITEQIYLDGKHDCTGLDEFDPAECPPCDGCGHCSERHQDLPVGRGVCDVETCQCIHLSTGDDCTLCSGLGTVSDNDDNEYECLKCGGHGVAR